MDPEPLENRPQPQDASARRRWALALVVPAVAVAALSVGLRLRPVKATEVVAVEGPQFDGKALKFPGRYAERIGLKAEAVQRGKLRPAIQVVGDVGFDPQHVGAVGTRTKGFVRRVMKVEGDEVKEGEILGEIQSADLGQAQADGLVAEVRRKAAERNARREAELLERRLTTAREAEDAQLTLQEQQAALAASRQRVAVLGGKGGAGLGVYALRSPLRGVVVERKISVGQSVDGEMVAFRVADLDHLWIELAVFERSIGAIRVGDQVEVAALADGKRVLSGRVAHVGAVIDPSTRSADVRVEVDNTARALRPGQAVQAVISASGPSREATLVAERAVTYIDGKATVFVLEGPLRVAPTPVKLGESDGKHQEILEGLEAGQQVVVDGVLALKSELFR